MKISRRSFAALCAALLLAIVGSACSATPDATSANTTTDASSSGEAAPTAGETQSGSDDTAGQTESVDTTDAAGEPEPAPTATEAPVEAPVGSIDVVFDDGRSWTMETIDCRVTPDSAFGVFFMEGAGAGELALSVVESWPLDGDRTRGTAWIAIFTDDAGLPYRIGEAEVVEQGTALSFTTDVFEGYFGEEVLTTGTFSCTP